MANNHNYEDYKLRKSDVEFAKCKPKHPKPKKILLECGEGTGSRTFTSSDDAPFQLAHITLDTTCFKRPKVLIKFSSIVRMTNTSSGDGTVRLQYELFRVCDGREPISLGVWMFEVFDVFSNVVQDQEESFSFIFCECTNCLDFCEYFITATPVEITNANATVSNGRMAALTQSTCESLAEKLKTSNSKYDSAKCRPKHPKPKEIILACGQGNGFVIFRDFELQPPAEIAHVTIDTTCLSKPKVLLEFSSLVKIDEQIRDIRLQFELFRVCGDGEPLSRGIWEFAKTGETGTLEVVRAMSFIFCECEIPSSCCEYFVTVTVIELVSDSGTEPDVIVGNARMTALAQSTNGCFYYENCNSSDEGKAKEILLECGMGTGSRTFTSSSNSSFQLAQVTIDTTEFCKPTVNIEFSNTVSYERTAGGQDIQLRYELFRVGDNRRPISLGVWVLEAIDIGGSEKYTSTFDFIFCDCATCPGCYDYFVSVTPIEIEEGGLSATVNNSRMAALAQEI